MKIIIQFKNKKIRGNKKKLEMAIKEFVSLFQFLDVCVDLTDVKRDLMELRNENWNNYLKNEVKGLQGS